MHWQCVKLVNLSSLEDYMEDFTPNTKTAKRYHDCNVQLQQPLPSEEDTLGTLEKIYLRKS